MTGPGRPKHIEEEPVKLPILIELSEKLTIRIHWEYGRAGKGEPVIHMPGRWRTTVRQLVDLCHERKLTFAIPPELTRYLLS